MYYCILLFLAKTWVILAASDCFTPLICNGQASWVKNSGLRKECPKCDLNGACKEKIEQIHGKYQSEVNKLERQINELWKMIQHKTGKNTTSGNDVSNKTRAPNTSSRNDVTTMIDFISAISPTTGSKRTAEPSCIGFLWEQECFWGNISTTRKNFAAFTATCAYGNSIPANIYNEQHYNKTMNYLRLMIPGVWLEMTVWLGMKYDTTNDVLSFANGTQASWHKWAAGQKNSGSAYAFHNRVALKVLMIKSKSEGMKNVMQTFAFDGVLCSFKI